MAAERPWPRSKDRRPAGPFQKMFKIDLVAVGRMTLDPKHLARCAAGMRSAFGRAAYEEAVAQARKLARRGDKEGEAVWLCIAKELAAQQVRAPNPAMPRHVPISA